MQQVLRTKGHRDRAHSVFQLPDHQRDQGAFAGTHREISPPLRSWAMEMLTILLLIGAGMYQLFQINPRSEVEAAGWIGRLLGTRMA